MIYPTGATRVFVVCGVTDMRKSFNSLYAIVEHQLMQDPMSGHLFAFCNRKRNRLKVLCWDGTGLWVCAKRLEKGAFSWPNKKEASSIISAAAWSMLLGGLESAGTRTKTWYRKSAG
jgi:transposase